MANTNLRIPEDLHHKLTILAEADERSLNSLILNVLREHVTSFEESLYDTYGDEEFDNTFSLIFGHKIEPYYIPPNKKTDIKEVHNIIRGAQRKGSRNHGKLLIDTGLIDIEKKDK